MGERQDLVSATSIESPLISEDQKSILVRQTTLYLQSKRIHIDKTTFGLGAEVIADALRRGLNLSGVDIAHAGKSVTKYVKAGIEERDVIFFGAREITNKTNSGGGGQYMGELALPRPLIEQASEETPRFYLKRDISVSEKLYKLYEIRQKSLAELSDKVVGYLPEVLIANAREKLNTNDEKSRLVKNALVSAVFTERINPIISIDELWGCFQNYQKKPENYFTEQNLADFINELNLDTDQIAYIGDLYCQTREIFESKKDTTFDAKDKDKFYTKFDRDLLLLHPALEEEQIVLDYDKQDGHTPSVWDDGVCHEVKGYRVPSKVILIAALRQAEAKGSTGRANRIKDAVRSWNKFEVDKNNLPIKIRQFQKQLEGENITVKSLREKWGERSRPRKNIENILTKKQQEFGHLSVVYKAHLRQVNLSREKLKEATSLLSIARNSQNQEFMLPRDYYLDLMTKKILSYSTSINSLARSIDKEGKIIEVKLSSTSDLSFIRDDITGIAKDVFNEEVFMKYASEFERLYEELKKSKNGHIFKELPAGNKKRFAKYLARNISLLRIKSFRKYHGFSRIKNWDINMLNTLAEKKPDDPRVLRMGSIIILSTLRPNIKKLEKRYDSKMKAKEGQAETQRRLDILLIDSNIPLSSDAMRSTKWAENFHRETEISELDDDLGENLNSEAGDFSKLYVQGFSKILPKVVDKEGYRQAVENTLPGLRNNVDIWRLSVQTEKKKDLKNYKKNKVYIAKLAYLNKFVNDLNHAQSFLKQLDSRYFRFDIATGMRTTRYLELISRKTLLLKRLKGLPKLREEHEELDLKVTILEIEKKIFEVTYKKSAISEKIKELKALDPFDSHIERMKNLGFAVKV